MIGIMYFLLRTIYFNTHLVVFTKNQILNKCVIKEKKGDDERMLGESPCIICYEKLIDERVVP